MTAKRRSPSGATAFMQSPHLRVKDIAAAWDVSERSLYMAKWLHENRPDLVPEIMAGRQKLAPAYLQAKGQAKPPKSSFDKLAAAWNAATDADRVRLTEMILAQLDETRDRLERSMGNRQ